MLWSHLIKNGATSKSAGKKAKLKPNHKKRNPKDTHQVNKAKEKLPE